MIYSSYYVDYDIEHCHFFSYFFLPNLQLNIGKKYIKTANIIDESLILEIVLRNYSTKPSYIFQLKRELKVWKYIFNCTNFTSIFSLGSCTISKLIFRSISYMYIN
jgi:hypothetical protein